MRIFYFLAFAPFFLSCGSAPEQEQVETTENQLDSDSTITEQPLYCNADVVVGAARFDQYQEQLEGMKVAVVGNQSSMVGNVHLVDTLLARGVEVSKVFSPEHGFRGDANAGEKVKDGVDPKSGLPVISLYGSNKKPQEGQLADVDVILFDIQDVGARFYTYISTMTYVMEAAAENGKSVIILDRPNPNGHYVDGPVLKDGYTSFVGMHKVPVVHGMTIGEYATMVNEEGWLKGGIKCELNVVKCEGWDHSKFYELPIAPSPNLPDMKSIYWYPSLCFFEGTVVSVGRGTDIPFQCMGHPKFEVDILSELDSIFHFTPNPNAGSKDPKLNGEECYGYDLSKWDVKMIREQRKLNLTYLHKFYTQLKMDKSFFLSNGFINKLAGNSELKSMLLEGAELSEIESSWKKEVEDFKVLRSKYLLYKDFE